MHLEQRDTVLVVRIKLKALSNRMVMPRRAGRRYRLAFVMWSIRFLLSPAKMGGPGRERGDLNVQPLFLSVGNVIEYFDLRRWEGWAEMKKKGKFGPRVLSFLRNKASWKTTDINMQYMRAVWRRWMWSVAWQIHGAGGEGFESAGENVDVLLCHAKAQSTRRTRLVCIARGSPSRWGVSVDRQCLLSARYKTTSIPGLENTGTKILMAATWLYLSYAEAPPVPRIIYLSLYLSLYLYYSVFGVMFEAVFYFIFLQSEHTSLPSFDPWRHPRSGSAVPYRCLLSCLVLRGWAAVSFLKYGALLLLLLNFVLLTSDRFAGLLSLEDRARLRGRTLPVQLCS